MTQAMRHTDMGLVLLNAPRPNEESKEQSDGEQEEMTTKNGEGFVITSVEGVPTME